MPRAVAGRAKRAKRRAKQRLGLFDPPTVDGCEGNRARARPVRGLRARHHRRDRRHDRAYRLVRPSRDDAHRRLRECAQARPRRECIAPHLLSRAVRSCCAISARSSRRRLRSKAGRSRRRAGRSGGVSRRRARASGAPGRGVHPPTAPSTTSCTISACSASKPSRRRTARKPRATPSASASSDPDRRSPSFGFGERCLRGEAAPPDARRAYVTGHDRRTHGHGQIREVDSRAALRNPRLHGRARSARLTVPVRGPGGSAARGRSGTVGSARAPVAVMDPRIARVPRMGMALAREGRHGGKIGSSPSSDAARSGHPRSHGWLRKRRRE